MAAMSGPGNGENARRARVTIREIADLAGVSIATVSRVVNGRDDVSEETREAVQRIVRERGYSANRSARGLSAGRTGFVGVTVPMVNPPYFSSILSGAAEALDELDMRIVLCPTLHQHDREVSLLERLMHGTTDGALLILPEETNDELEVLLHHGYRFVVVDPLKRLEHRIPGVSSANTAGADQAMRHLLDLPERPTAIFAFNDNLAIGAMQAARARGLRVPEDVSIVGFDDTELAEVVTPGLTTVRQPLAEMGRMAVSLLGRALENHRFEPVHVELATRLVVRSSTQRLDP